MALNRARLSVGFAATRRATPGCLRAQNSPLIVSAIKRTTGQISIACDDQCASDPQRVSQSRWNSSFCSGTSDPSNNATACSLLNTVATNRCRTSANR